VFWRSEQVVLYEQANYWTEAVVFTTSNNSFGPTEINYLENRFVNLSLEAKRYTVKNDNDVTGTSINAREAWKTSDGKTLKEIETTE